MALVCATTGPDQRPEWIAKHGTFSVCATVDKGRDIIETDEHNNTQNATFTIPNGRLIATQ
jgi:hypothetical protein